MVIRNLTVDEEVALTAIWERTPFDLKALASLQQKGLVLSTMGAGMSGPTLLHRITKEGKAALARIDATRDAEAKKARMTVTVSKKVAPIPVCSFAEASRVAPRAMKRRVLKRCSTPTAER